MTTITSRAALERRRAEWTAPEPRYTAALAKYARLVGSASRGRHHLLMVLTGRATITATAWRRSKTVVAVALVVVWVLLPAPAAGGGAAGGGYAGSSGEADAAGPPTAIAHPAGSLPGIDVSHHQDAIDWAQVAASGQRFAIAKATEGRTFVDPRYATNKAGAETNGVAFTAYHFARPDGTPNDAIAEADHFVDTAQLASGNLFPVLDIERTGGLSQAEVTTWILTWLGRVTERLGVRPMVYTSPSGWESRTGDTTAVADAGYTVLWVAHWGVAEPRLPANGWSGNGWTFWQYDNCGSIPGIQGCVDVDRYESADLGPVTIPSPDVTPPNVTIATPSDVAEPMKVTFGEVVRQVTSSNVFIRSTDTGMTLQAASSCRSGAGAEVDCANGNVRTVLVQPLAFLLPGEAYEGVVNPVGAPAVVVDRGGNPAPATAQAFEAPSEVEQDSPAATYGWRSVSSRRAFGRSYALERAAGASVSFAFTGRSVTWYTVAGPTQGKATVWIDGVRRGAFDQYAAAHGFRVPRTFAGLQPGPHTIVVRVLGTGSSKATDTQVVVDAFEADAGIVANPQGHASWGTVDAPRASGGDLAASDLAGASVTFAFRGTAVAWITLRDRWQGRAAIYVDGSLVRTVDNYASTPAFGVMRSVLGLADTAHTLRIVVLGEARQASKGTLVSVDRLAVLA